MRIIREANKERELKGKPLAEAVSNYIKLRLQLAYGLRIAFICVLVAMGGLLSTKPCLAMDYSDHAVCRAIYEAEGGAKATYLYGIRSVHYKDVTEARRICLNTVKHARRDWNRSGSKGDFIVFLGRRYCPVGASNDPRGLNVHWVNNVKWFLAREK